LLLLAAVSLEAGTRQTGTIEIVAGTGVRGFSGDGGPATEASLWVVRGLALDSKGNLFIADSWHQRVRQVSPGGIITTVAGSGPVGMGAGRFWGDGGPATQAGLNEPQGVAVDGTGTLFISEWFSHRVRRVSPDGKITTAAGTGKQGFSGDGGPATVAELSGPCGLAVDRAGNLFISDSGNTRVRKVSLDGTITTVAGGGTHGLVDGIAATAATVDPFGLVVDGGGNLLVADNRNLILKVNGVAAPGLLLGPEKPAEESEKQDR
jgi:sugar lactone lactonase YvrE